MRTGDSYFYKRTINARSIIELKKLDVINFPYKGNRSPEGPLLLYLDADQVNLSVLCSRWQSQTLTY